MNVGGGEAADQMVRMMLSGTEVMVRLSGSALKNMLALTMALASNRKVLSGKVNMGKMLRETRDLRRFPMTPEQYKQFKKLAKKHKLLFSVIKDKDDKGKLIDVILPVTELERANAIFERILYTLPPEPERKPAKPLQQGHEVFQPERQVQERQAPEQVQVRRREPQSQDQQKQKKPGRSGRFPHLRPIPLEPRLNGGPLTRPPRSAALFGHRGVDFCNVRVSFRPRTVFSLVLLTLGHRGRLAALVWGPLGYLLLWRR